MGHLLPPNYRWSSSLLHSTGPVSMCLQCLGSSLQRERNCVHFESPIVGANVCQTDIPKGRGLHFIACTFCFLTKSTNEPGDTARQKQSSSILELATYCYNVLKKQLSPLSWHKAVHVPHELSHIQLKWWWECTTEREKLHFSWHDSLSPQSSFMYANANSKDGSVGLRWGGGGNQITIELGHNSASQGRWGTFMRFSMIELLKDGRGTLKSPKTADLSIFIIKCYRPLIQEGIKLESLYFCN